MDDHDMRYLTRRAAEESQWAIEATVPEVAATHRRNAECYRELLDRSRDFVFRPSAVHPSVGRRKAYAAALSGIGQ